MLQTGKRLWLWLLSESRQTAGYGDGNTYCSAHDEWGEPIVNAYLFDENMLKEDSPLIVKVFDGYTKEWAEFILKNRKNISDTPVHNYDIVVGPIADDTVGLQMRRFEQGVYQY